MTLLAPLGLAFGLALPVIVLFYLLKVRRAEREVSSVLLWELLRRDHAAHEPWQRLRWSVLLVLQLAVLAALTLAFARPAAVAPAPVPHFDAIILDTSASMTATDVAPSRFDQARDAAQALIDQAPDGSTFALIEAGATARVVVPETSDRLAVRRGLAGLTPSDAPGAEIEGATVIANALRIGAALAAGRPGATLHLFSDGAYPHPSQWDDLATPTGSLGEVSLRFHPVGSAAANRAITAMAMRPAGAEATSATQLFARIQNFDARPARVPVALSADGKPIETREVDLPPDGAQQIFFSGLPPDARIVELELTQPDPLPAGDQAILIRGDPPSTPVLLVSRGNLFLQKALGAIPGLNVYQVSPRSFSSVDLAPYAVIVFDGYAPDRPPTKNALLINPIDTPWLPIQGTVRDPAITLWRGDDPILAYVDLRTIRISRASNVTLPDWARPLIESNGIPLGFVGETGGRRVVGLTFDLQQSNLPLSASYPIFMANVIRFLTPPTVAQAPSLAPLEPAILQLPPGVDRVVVDGPAGQEWTIVPTEPVVRFEQTGQVGLYRATEYLGSQVVAVQHFAVDLFNPAESDLRPRANLTNYDAHRVPTAADTAPIVREFAPWLLAFAIPLLLGEWWWYHRRS